MKRNTMIKGYAFIILSAVIFGCMPLMAKAIYKEGVGAMSLVFLRNCLSVPVVAIIAVATRQSFRVKVSTVPYLAVLGVVGSAITPFLLFSSYTYMSSGTATVLHFVYPAAVLIIQLIFFKSGLRWANILSLVLCTGGIALFYTPGAGIDPIGGLIAILSGITYAMYIVLLGAFGAKRLPPFILNFYMALSSALGMIPICLLSGGVELPKSVLGWMLCLLLAISINVGAVILFQRGAFIIGGEKASILSAFEPITSVVIGYIVFSEPFGWRTAVGAVLVISAGVLIAVSDLARKKN